MVLEVKRIRFRSTICLKFVDVKFKIFMTAINKSNALKKWCCRNAISPSNNFLHAQWNGWTGELPVYLPACALSPVFSASCTLEGVLWV